MKKNKVSNTDLECSAIVLGSVEMGSSLSEKESYRLLDMYVDSGGNMVDTAEVYGHWMPSFNSSSETVIGKWMRERKNRSQLLVTTKGGHQKLTEMLVQRVTPEAIKADLDGSLERLQVETIDLYWLHRDDPSRPVGEIVETLNEQVKAGKIKYFGCSNWVTERMFEAFTYAKEHGLQSFCASQVWWSLAAIDRSKVSDPNLAFMDEHMYQYYKTSQTSVFGYSSQAKGLFTKMDSIANGGRGIEIPDFYQLPENTTRYRKIKTLADELSVSINQIVLSYLSSQSFPSFPIVGCRTPDQLRDSLHSSQIYLTAEQLTFLVS